MKDLLRNKSLFQTYALAALILLWPVWRLAGVAARIWLVYLVAMTDIVLMCFEHRYIGWSVSQRKLSTLQWLLVIFFLWNLQQIMAGVISGAGNVNEPFMTLMLVLLFFLVSAQRDSWRTIYPRVLLVSAAPIYLGLMWHFLIDPSFCMFLNALLLEDQGLTAFLLLVNVTAAEEYYRRRDKTERLFCLIMLLMGFLLLLIQKNPVGVLLMSASFFLALVLHEPVRELIRRVVQLAFVWFLFLSNMCLLTNYTGLIKVKCTYDLEGCIYLELLMAVAGAFFFSWWNKLPEAKEYQVMYGFQIAVKKILTAFILLIFLLLAPGGRLEEVRGSVLGSYTLLSWAQDLRAYCSSHNGTFYDMLGRFGILGGVWLVLFSLTATETLWKHLKDRRVQPKLAVLVILYFIQSLFFSQETVTTPIYVILCATALKSDFGEEGQLGKESERI